MSFAIVVFLSVFLLIGSLGFLLFYREAMVQRIAAVVFDRPQKSGIAGTIEKAGESLGVVLGKVEKVVPKSQSEISVIQQRLVRAGFRNESAMMGCVSASSVAARVVAWSMPRPASRQITSRSSTSGRLRRISSWRFLILRPSQKSGAR